MVKLLLLICLLCIQPSILFGQSINDYSYQSRINDQQRKDNDLFAAASLVFFTGSAMDITSSYGQYEANPILKNSDNKFSLVRGLAITGGVYTIAYCIKNKHPKAARILLFISGSARIGIGIRNFTVRGREHGQLVTIRN